MRNRLCPCHVITFSKDHHSCFCNVNKLWDRTLSLPVCLQCGLWELPYPITYQPNAGTPTSHTSVGLQIRWKLSALGIWTDSKVSPQDIFMFSLQCIYTRSEGVAIKDFINRKPWSWRFANLTCCIFNFSCDASHQLVYVTPIVLERLQFCTSYMPAFIPSLSHSF